MSYQAVRRTTLASFAMCWWANSVTSENSPNSAGVLRRIALSDPCLCVSKPRRCRTSWKVASICQRLTNHEMICLGSTPRSVHNRARVSNPSWGSRISTQRNGTAGDPVPYQMAVFETISTGRSPPPYQLLTVMGSQVVFGSSATTERFGTREPFRRGLPICPGLRGAAGS